MPPSISSVNGTIAHGQTITIGGTGFGSKGGTNANKPLIWADFEASINPTSLGHITSWNVQENLTRTVGGTQHGVSGANVVGTKSAGVKSWSFAINHTFASKLYTAGKRRWSSFPATSNYKFFRLWSSVGTADFVTTTHSGGMCYDEAHSGQANRFQGVTINANEWRNEEFLWRKATVPASGDPEVANGYWEYIVNGVQDQVLTNLCSDLSANYGQGNGLRVLDNFDTNEDLADGTTLYMDDMYVDDTWARVIIGNASTLGSCTVREVQIPSSWSDTSVSITVNRGSFGAADNAYLYVVDSDNVPSTGQAMTFGDTFGGGGASAPSVQIFIEG